MWQAISLKTGRDQLTNDLIWSVEEFPFYPLNNEEPQQESEERHGQMTTLEPSLWEPWGNMHERYVNMTSTVKIATGHSGVCKKHTSWSSYCNHTV